MNWCDEVEDGDCDDEDATFKVRFVLGRISEGWLTLRLGSRIYT